MKKRNPDQRHSGGLFFKGGFQIFFPVKVKFVLLKMMFLLLTNPAGAIEISKFLKNLPALRSTKYLKNLQFWVLYRRGTQIIRHRA